jgi:hypothetical protein
MRRVGHMGRGSFPTSENAQSVMGFEGIVRRRRISFHRANKLMPAEPIAGSFAA